MSHNVHNLVHIPEDVLHLGSLQFFSAYPFENYMQIIKYLTTRSAKPLQQIIKRLNEIEINRICSPIEEDVFFCTTDQHF